MSHQRWQLLSPSIQAPGAQPSASGGLQGEAGRLARQLLANRGVTGDVEAFLSASPDLLGDPFLLPEMGVAVTRIRWAIRQEQPIAVYGDFDVDGVTATVLLAEGLAHLGAKVVPYIPHRFDEGYGLNQPALERLGTQGIRLVITADTGTTAHQEIAWAQSQGLDILVTDHHVPRATLPPALATINPRRADSPYPFPQLAGVGVAFKLLQALGVDTANPSTGSFDELSDSARKVEHVGVSRLCPPIHRGASGRKADRMTSGQGLDPSAGSGLDLVALGTIADMMPVLGENRYLVQRGLAALNRTHRLGLRCLMEGAGLSPGQVDSEDVSFCLAPRLNAAGRLAHARLSYSLLTAQSPTQAAEHASALEAYNRERQRRTEEVCRRAQEMIQARFAAGLPPLIMLGDPEFDPGVVGISASQLSGQYYRPVVLCSRGPETSRGSARSIPEFNIVAALAQCQPWLLRFGGHPQAAGFTARTEDIPHIERRLVETAARELAGVELRPRLHVDAIVRLADLRGDLLRFISRLAPFGPGNPPPTFASLRVEVADARSIGNGKHLRLKLRQGQTVWDGVAFDLMEQHGLPAGPVDMVYTLGIDSWQRQPLLELRLLDFAPAGTVRISSLRQAQSLP